MKPDYKIDRKDLDKLIPNQKKPEITKEQLDLLKGQLPPRRVMRKLLRQRGRSFSQELYKKYRDKNASNR